MNKKSSNPGDIAVIDTGMPLKEAKPDYTFYWFRMAELCGRCIAESMTSSDGRVINAIDFLIATIPSLDEQEKIYSQLDQECQRIRKQDVDTIEMAQEIQTLYIRYGYGGCMRWADNFLGFFKTNRIGVLCKAVETISDEELIRFMEGKKDDIREIT
jgi:hypothetical protein